jgi:hypothetical protein
VPRRKSEKIPANTRAVKEADWHLTRHNAKSGVSAFKKKLRHQYGRRLTNRELAVWTWENNNRMAGAAKQVTRPESAPVASQRHYRQTWKLADTMRIAFERAFE